LTSNKFCKTGSAQGFETPLLYTGGTGSASRKKAQKAQNQTYSVCAFCAFLWLAKPSFR